jgi:hypothetical protein
VSSCCEFLFGGFVTLLSFWLLSLAVATSLSIHVYVSVSVYPSPSFPPCTFFPWHHARHPPPLPHTLTPHLNPYQTNCDSNRLPNHNRPHLRQPHKKIPSSTIPGSATVVNGVDISGIGNVRGTAEGFVFDPKIASLIHQLWRDLVIPNVMDHSSDFYLMDSPI